jgi:hypothetical protein
MWGGDPFISAWNDLFDWGAVTEAYLYGGGGGGHYEY